MPEEEHRKLKRSAKKAGLTGKRAAAYTYGTLHKISLAERRSMVKTHVFNGRRYYIDIDNVDGWCDQYKTNKRMIHIITKPNTKNELITILHESLHAENWAETEEVVDRVSTEIGSFLWRLGFRKVK